MLNPSKALNVQDGCCLFKLAAETRNHIYELVFTIDTNEDGNIELNEDTVIPSNALIRTCQQIYSESREMCRAAYHDYPTKRPFFIDVTDSKTPFIPKLSREFFLKMRNFWVLWRADEFNDGSPLPVTTCFMRPPDSRSTSGGWAALVDIGDVAWRPQNARWTVKRVTRTSALYAKITMNMAYPSRHHLRGKVPSSIFADAVSEAVYLPKPYRTGPDVRVNIWGVVRPRLN